MPGDTLEQDLRGRSDEQLAQLLAARPDLMAPLPTDFARWAGRACNSGSLFRVVDGLDGLLLGLLAVLVATPEPRSVDGLAARTGLVPPVVAEALSRLGALALVWGAADRLRIPGALGRVLREGGPALPGGTTAAAPGLLQPPEVSTTAVAVADVERAGGAAAATAVHRLEQLGEAFGAAPPPVLRTGGLGVRELRRLASALDVSEPVAALTVELAVAAGLVDRTLAVDPRWVPTTLYDDWLAEAPASRWAAVAAAWLAADRLPGLVGGRDESDKPVNALGPQAAAYGAAAHRRRVLEVLAELPPGTAAELPAVVARLRWLAPRRAGALADSAVGWTLAEAELLGVTGRGGITSAGRALLVGGPAGAAAAMTEHLPRPVREVVLQADLTAVAAGPLETGLAAGLGMLADVESTGGATVYRFTADSVRRAMDAGSTPAEIAEFLDASSRTPVPQPLAYLIEDVARRHGRLRVRTLACAIVTEDEALLREVAAHRRTAALGLAPLAPTVLACAARAEKALAVLREAGFAPVAEAADGTLVLQRPQAHRIDAVPRPRRVGPAPPDAARLLMAVRAVRAGDRSSVAAGDRSVDAYGGRERPTAMPAPEELEELLEESAEEGRAVWISYVNAQGYSSERVIEPIAVDAGYVTAYDHRRGDVRTFALHRIAGMAPVDGEDLPAPP